jgi:16S rRNA (cytidine1402-2'-O)-methyltransferase
LLESCEPATQICLASDMTLETESIVTRPVADWRRTGLVIGKRPTVFLMLAR